jgi:hypothetical protein
MAVFAKLLVAQNAFIEELQSQIITLKNGGLIQSENFSEGKSGFRIKHNGDAEFNNANVRGHIEADSGYIKNMNLDNVTIGREAVFLGTIKSGPIFISNETTASQPAQVFNAGTRIRDIVDALGANRIINVSTGFYGNRTGLVQVITLSDTIQTSPPYPRWRLTLVFNEGASLEFNATNYMSGNQNATISQQLSMGGSVPGKIFRIENIPTGSAGLQSGSVYKNGNYLMIV